MHHVSPLRGMIRLPVMPSDVKTQEQIPYRKSEQAPVSILSVEKKCVTTL